MDEINSPAEFDLTIFIIDGHRVDITAPAKMLLEEMLGEFIEGAKLPKQDADGTEYCWELWDKSSGRRCNLDLTVAQICTGKKTVELVVSLPMVAG